MQDQSSDKWKRLIEPPDINDGKLGELAPYEYPEGREWALTAVLRFLNEMNRKAPSGYELDYEEMPPLEHDQEYAPRYRISINWEPICVLALSGHDSATSIEMIRINKAAFPFWEMLTSYLGDVVVRTSFLNGIVETDLDRKQAGEEWGLVEPFDIDDGELAGLTSQQCFTLGVEWQMFREKMHAGIVFSMMIHTENRERLEKMLIRNNRKYEIDQYHDDWVSIGVGPGEWIKG